jgi:hypothetical protein
MLERLSSEQVAGAQAAGCIWHADPSARHRASVPQGGESAQAVAQQTFCVPLPLLMQWALAHSPSLKQAAPFDFRQFPPTQA